MRRVNMSWLALTLIFACASCGERHASAPTGPVDAYLTAEVRTRFPGFVGQEAELVGRNAEMQREYREHDERDRREQFKQEEKTRGENERAQEREWDQIGTTPCTSFGIGTVPQLCIEHEGPDSAALGTQVHYRVRWRNLPDGAYIRVWSRNAAPAGDRWRYFGPAGAITDRALGRTRDGDMHMTWDGKSTWCAPADAPMMCDNGEVGRYVLRAAIFTGTDPFWPSWPDLNPIPVHTFAQSETAPFTLDGAPRLFQANWANSEPIYDALPPGTLSKDYLRRHLLHLGPWQEGWLRTCAHLPLDTPFAGSVEVCFPRSRRDQYGIALRPGDIVASGDARWAPGVIGADAAVAHATTYAILMTGTEATFPAYPGEADLVRKLRSPPAEAHNYSLLVNRALENGLTYVNINQPYPTFHTDTSGGWWIVEFRLSINKVNGGSIHDWGQVFLRVDNLGTVCRVEEIHKTGQVGQNMQQGFTHCIPGTQRKV